MSLRDIARRRVETISPESNVLDAARRMALRHVGCLVVADAERHPIGIVTDRDLATLVLAQGLDARTTKVAEVMTPHPTTIRGEAGIADAAAIMREHGVRRLPVVDERGELVGIVTFDDLLSLLGEELSSLSVALGHELFRERRERPDVRGRVA